MTEPIVVARKLSYSYPTDLTKKAALVEIDLEISRGSCVAVVGVTGSGKTTLMQHLNGLLRPTAGSIVVDGIEVGSPSADLRSLRRRVGMLFQFPESQLFERTVFADVAFGPRNLGLRRREVLERVRSALETVGLPFQEYARRSPFELSGGQRRRVALAGVLAMSPILLALDEPTAGLDALGRAEFYEYLHRIRQEREVTVLLVSHDMAEVATLADRLFVLHQGHLVLQGTPRAVFAQADRLREWGLLAPPLSELIYLLRRKGVDIPEGTMTLEEAYAALRTLGPGDECRSPLGRPVGTGKQSDAR